MVSSRYALQKEIPPGTVGINEKSGDTSVDLIQGAWIDASGYNQATLHVKFAHGGASSSTDLTFKVHVAPDEGATEYPLQAAAVSGGVATLSDLQYSKATAGASTNFIVDIPLDYDWFRLADLAVASGAATDFVSVTVRLGKI